MISVIVYYSLLPPHLVGVEQITMATNEFAQWKLLLVHSPICSLYVYANEYINAPVW